MTTIRRLGALWSRMRKRRDAPPPPYTSPWKRKPQWCDRRPPLVAADLQARIDANLAARRTAIRKAGTLEDEQLSDFDPRGTLGLALSGGGIRSATISLGIVQGLASKRRLLDFDYCSTVSGGGYCGSFLGALFMPDNGRGDVPQDDPRPGRRNDEPHEKARFALAALRHDPRQTECIFPMAKVDENGKHICDGTQVLNPVWWLREHSRYLAPSGMTDYLLALATVVRNWLSMVYVLILPIALLAFLAIGATYLMGQWHPANVEENWTSGWWIPQGLVETLQTWLRAGIPHWLDDAVFPVPPPASCVSGACVWEPVRTPVPISLIAFVAVVPALFWVAALGMAFWLTSYMSLTESPPFRRLLNGLWSSWWAYTSATVLLLATLIGLAYLVLDQAAPGDETSRLYFVLATFWAAWIAAVVPWAGAHFVSRHAWRDSRSPDAFTAAVRLRLTRWTAAAMRTLLALAAAAAFDTLARWIYAAYHGRLFELSWSLVAPVGAFLLSRLTQGLGQAGSTVTRIVDRYLGGVMMLAAFICYGSLALAVHIGLQYMLFEGYDWPGALLADGARRIADDSGNTLEPGVGPRFLVMAMTLGGLFIAAGISSNFINLSSLNGFYASRLTRAYLGAANIDRLRDWAAPGKVARITEAHAGDQIEVEAYQRSFAEGANFAPMHLINVTLNETRSKDRSQVLERDRKGVPLVFSPEGLLINPGKELSDETFYGWEKLQCVEMLSVGQLCAISGAAASTAMGSRTSLGTALALTFANIRLGYWWNLNGLLTRRKDMPPEGQWYDWVNAVETYAYLWREMTARYHRTTRRVNISDGGHFENSGAYELLRRRVGTILVADNGADPEFHFEDLEQLMRKARLDLGIEVTVPEAARARDLLQALGTDRAGKSALSDLFLNCGEMDWRSVAAERRPESEKDRAPQFGAAVPHGSAFCLLLEARPTDPALRGGDGDYHGLIVWMKPRLFAGLGHDVAGYATGHPKFPHETTSDQFFNEAQWESYRKLGETMIERLLDTGTGGPDLFRHIDAQR